MAGAGRRWLGSELPRHSAESCRGSRLRSCWGSGASCTGASCRSSDTQGFFDSIHRVGVGAGDASTGSSPVEAVVATVSRIRGRYGEQVALAFAEHVQAHEPGAFAVEDGLAGDQQHDSGHYGAGFPCVGLDGQRDLRGSTSERPCTYPRPDRSGDPQFRVDAEVPLMMANPPRIVKLGMGTSDNWSSPALPTGESSALHSVDVARSQCAGECQSATLGADS